MDSVIITGANCFIGKRLTKKLNDEGYKVFAVVRENFSNLEMFSSLPNVQLEKCDMDNYDRLSSLISESVSVGINLAWNGTRGESRADIEQQNRNVKNTKKAIEEMIELGCKTIFTAGSQAEYGPNYDVRIISEDTVCKPNTEYGKAKLSLYTWANGICKDRNIRFVEPRFFSLYGEDDFENTMIISTVRKMLENKDCELTECNQMWDFLYIDDAIDALYKLVKNPNASGVFNFGSGISKPLKEYIQEMQNLTKSESKLLFGAVEYPSTGIVHTYPSIDKLKTSIDWGPHTSFEEGIRRVIQYQKVR